MAPITICHNPACGTSCNVRALTRDSGVEPRVVESLQHPPSRDERVQLLTTVKMPVREHLRRSGSSYDELGLSASHRTDEPLLDFIVQHPSS